MWKILLHFSLILKSIPIIPVWGKWSNMYKGIVEMFMLQRDLEIL